MSTTCQVHIRIRIDRCGAWRPGVLVVEHYIDGRRWEVATRLTLAEYQNMRVDDLTLRYFPVEIELLQGVVMTGDAWLTEPPSMITPPLSETPENSDEYRMYWAQGLQLSAEIRGVGPAQLKLMDDSPTTPR